MQSCLPADSFLSGVADRNHSLLTCGESSLSMWDSSWMCTLPCSLLFCHLPRYHRQVGLFTPESTSCSFLQWVPHSQRPLCSFCNLNFLGLISCFALFSFFWWPMLRAAPRHSETAKTVAFSKSFFFNLTTTHRKKLVLYCAQHTSILYNRNRSFLEPGHSCYKWFDSMLFDFVLFYSVSFLRT